MEVTFLVVLKTDANDFIRRDVIANGIDSEEINFLCGRKTIKNWKTKVDFDEDKLEFKGKDKNLESMASEGGHLLAKLEIIGKWNDDNAVYLVKKEYDVTNLKAAKKIHKILNHNSKEQMYYAYRNSEKLDELTKKLIDDVVEKYEICKKNTHSKSRPSVVISRATDFNSVVAVDLKVVGDKYVLWMVFGFTQFIRGVVLKSKTPESVIRSMHGSWCKDLGFPMVGFWADNRGEFKN